MAGGVCFSVEGLRLRKKQSCQGLQYVKKPEVTPLSFFVEFFGGQDGDGGGQRKLLMSLQMEVKIRDPQNPKEMVFAGIPNSASSFQANGGFGEPRHLPLRRDD